jgi:hypothetical protein
MHIRLPLPASLRLAGPGLVLGAGALTLVTPLAWPWRAAVAALTLAVGGLLWRRYLRTRPVVVSGATDGVLRCVRADGRKFDVVTVHTGVVLPWLLSAELVGDEGRAALFVPGATLAAASHRQLRRALLGFQPGDTRHSPPQSEGGRGT